MRLIIKDYLLRLKEKDELDLLLCDLFLQMGYAVDSRPKTGNRQYGVDIRAHNSKEILLCVVKQGDIDRHIWNSNSNSVRQSLDEIRDVYVEFLKSDLCRKSLHIVVTSNGIIEETVFPNWSLYTNHNAFWNDVPVSIEFWDIDVLVADIQKYLFNEYIFDEQMRGQMRKALYFIDEGDYHNSFFETIIDKYLDSIDCQSSRKNLEKRLSGLHLSCQMIAHYAGNAGVFKISVMVMEYLLIRYWKYILINNLFERSLFIQWLINFLKEYEKWNQKYYDATKICSERPGHFPIYNSVEQRMILYDVLGRWTTYAYWLSFEGEKNETSKTKCFNIYSSIVNLLNNFPQLFYPPYDQHIGVMSMVFRLMIRLGREEDVCTLVDHLDQITCGNYILFKKYPTPDDYYRSAARIDLGLSGPEYKTSVFWGTMLEWIVLLDHEELYQSILQFLTKDLKNVTNSVWFLRAQEEAAFYDKLAMNLAGEGTSIDPAKSFDLLKEKVNFVMKQYENESFSYETYSFQALEFIVCRYYGYLPRVIKEAIANFIS